MTISAGQSVLIILTAALLTFLTRLFPFALFNGKRQVPQLIVYLGKVLPPAVIAVLVVYCVKDTQWTNYKSFIPQIVSVLVVAAIHLWKKNHLLSIGGGTLCFIILSNFIFSK